MIISESFQQGEVLGLKFGRNPFGRPKMIVHAYFIDGLLIDTGQRRMREYVAAATQPLDVQQIFVTHHHEDHTGNISALQNMHGCEVYASTKCCEIMKQPPPISLVQKMSWGDREAQQNLIPKDDKVETADFQFNIIPVPGHAPDMVVLYEPNRQWLFSADLYVNSHINYFLRNESVAQQIESIKKILKLDFKEMFCCHKPKLTNGKEKLAQKLTFLESFFEKVSTSYKKGNTAAQVFKDLHLKEDRFVKVMSGGNLSKMNMVSSVIRDLENT